MLVGKFFPPDNFGLRYINVFDSVKAYVKIFHYFRQKWIHVYFTENGSRQAGLGKILKFFSRVRNQKSCVSRETQQLEKELEYRAVNV